MVLSGTDPFRAIHCGWVRLFYGIPSLKRCKCSEAVYLSLRFPVFLFMIVHVFILFLWSLWSLWSLTCCFFYAFWTLLVDVTADYVMPKGGQFHAVSNLTGSHWNATGARFVCFGLWLAWGFHMKNGWNVRLNVWGFEHPRWMDVTWKTRQFHLRIHKNSSVLFSGAIYGFGLYYCRIYVYICVCVCVCMWGIRKI
jgi:hypothetical protein